MIRLVAWHCAAADAPPRLGCPISSIGPAAIERQLLQLAGEAGHLSYMGRDFRPHARAPRPLGLFGFLAAIVSLEALRRAPHQVRLATCPFRQFSRRQAKLCSSAPRARRLWSCAAGIPGLPVLTDQTRMFVWLGISPRFPSRGPRPTSEQGRRCKKGLRAAPTPGDPPRRGGVARDLSTWASRTLTSRPGPHRCHRAWSVDALPVGFSHRRDQGVGPGPLPGLASSSSTDRDAITSASWSRAVRDSTHLHLMDKTCRTILPNALGPPRSLPDW